MPANPQGRGLGVCSSAVGGTVSSGASMPTTRQRGFYSEVLDAEMDESAAHTLLQSAACGPHEEAL